MTDEKVKKRRNVERQTEFRERQKERGLVLVSNWVPESEKDTMNNIAKYLRDGGKIEFTE